MSRDSTLGFIKTILWFITTFWFAYLSAVVLWNIDRGSWMILLNFNNHGEAIIEIPIFIISAIWITIAGTKQIANFLQKYTDVGS